VPNWWHELTIPTNSLTIALMGTASLTETRPNNGYSPPGQPGPRGDVLAELKRAQRVTARQLATALGMSVNATRRHLRDLEAEGLIQHERQHRGVGAPVFAYRLSSAGEALFPRRYEATLLELLDRLVGREGREVAVATLEEQFGALAGKLGAETAGMGPADRLQAVAHAMTAEGYMAEAEVADATFGTLIEHNCAIQAVAERFPELCAAEARFLEAVLGASVERRGHILAGCGACEYHVRFGPPARAAEESV
jgi:DeoR family suf operon transcriptional repressor